MSKAKTAPARKIAVQNRKARHDYMIQSNLEAGIVLQGSEVKSLRKGLGSIMESYAVEENGEIFLMNAFIPEYTEASYLNHIPRRPRKLLLRHREIVKLTNAVNRKGMTLVPLSLYFNERGKVKVDLGVAQGKTKGDKRESSKEQDWKRQKARLLKGSLS